MGKDLTIIMLISLTKECEGLILNFECDEDILLTETVKSHLIVEEKKICPATVSKFIKKLLVKEH